MVQAQAKAGRNLLNPEAAGQAAAALAKRRLSMVEGGRARGRALNVHDAGQALDEVGSG